MYAMPMLGSICFFNNKGGVGKTTLACNVASCLSITNGLRVLIVDADPQCNATQLILPDSDTLNLYQSPRPAFSTLKEVLGPLMAGDASLRDSINVAPPSTNRFSVSVLAGHPKIALLEDHLSTSWSSFLGGYLGGARVSNWNTQLLRILKAREEFDLIIFDVGPSLGALNRSILIGVDYFLAPMGCDIFSLIGIANIADWLGDWRKNYDDSYARILEKHPDALDQYDIQPSAQPMSRFIGYTVQQYITKTIRSERRATGAYDTILNQIPLQINHRLGSIFADGLANDDVRLGDVPHMFSLVPLAQTVHSPIHGLTGGDGLSGGQYGQQRDYNSFVEALSASLLRNLMTAANEK